jgi:hypothetical protein
LTTVLSIRIAPAVRATDAAPPAGSVEAWIAATLALSDHNIRAAMRLIPSTPSERISAPF